MRRLLLIPLAAMAFAGCDCGGPPNQGQGAQGDLAILENQIEFGEACPKPSDPALQVEQITRQVHLRNDGRGVLNINKFEVEPSRADIFTFDPAQVPETLAMGQEVAVDITFLPKESGAIVADLTVVGDEKTVVLKLLGMGKSLPAHPTLSMRCPGGAFGDDRCASENPNVFFEQTPVDQTREMVIEVKNGGCPALVLSGLSVTTDTEYGADPATFALAEGQPTEVTVTGGATGEIKVAFIPRNSDSFDGTLTFETNDPERRQISMPLKGAGAVPTLVVETTIGCGFPDPAARRNCCNFSPKASPCTGRFGVRNSGAEPLTITAVSLRNGNPMFQLEDFSSLIGTEVPGFGEIPNAITVTYAAAAESGSDYLQVESTGGNASAELRGGSPPVLNVNPTSVVDFGTDLSVTEDYWQQVDVLNVNQYNQQLPLSISALSVDQSRPAFEISPTSKIGCEASLEAGDTIAAGQSRSVCMHFKASETAGGTYTGELVIQSNDPSYPEASNWFRRSMIAKTICNPAPFAEITVPLAGTTCPCNGTSVASECVDNTCHATISPYEIVSSTGGSVTLSAAKSYDLVPGADGQCTVHDRSGVASWSWRMTPVAGATLQPDSSDPSRATLTFTRATQYQIFLKVGDDTNQQSPEVSFVVWVKPAT